MAAWTLTAIRRLPDLLIVLLMAVVTGAVAGFRSPATAEAWPVLVDLGPAEPAAAAGFWFQDGLPLLVWQSQSSQAPFVLSLATGQERAWPLLAYDGLVPQEWRLVPRDSAAHIVWRESDGRIRSALVDRAGNTVRGPVDISARSMALLAAVPLTQGRALLFWSTPPAGQIASTLLDHEGRPGPVISYGARQIRHLAVTSDASGRVHMALISPRIPGVWQISYVLSAQPTPDLAQALAVGELTLPAQVAVRSLEIGLDRSHVYLVISTSDAARPDIERIEIVAFPPSDPGAATRTELLLPDRVSAGTEWSGAGLRTGPVTALQSTRRAASLRWARTAPGEHPALALALSLRGTQGWTQAVVYFQDGLVRGYQIVPAVLADAGPAQVTIAPDGAVWLSFCGLRGITPHRFVASTVGDASIEGSPEQESAVLRTSAAILVGLPFALAWATVAMLAVSLLKPQRGIVLFTAAVYSAAKLLWPPGLFTGRSLLLSALGPSADAQSAALVAGAITFAAGLILLAIARVHPDPHPRWLWPCALDALLTLMLFGGAPVV